MEIISFRFQDFLSAFIILFAVIDITGLTPIIIDMKQKGQNIIAWKAAVYSLVTFLAFLFMGNMILNLFQVDISSFAIAGALVIFVMAIEMLLGVEIFRNPPDLFVSGHSHILKVMYDKKLQLLHINPGAAGKYGFHKQRTLVRFSVEEGRFKDLEVIELADDQR